MFSATHSQAVSEPPPGILDPTRIPQYHFSNHHLPPSLQFEAWREMARPVMELAVPEGAEEKFAADILAWDLGRIAFTRSTTPAGRVYRSARSIRGSSLDHWCFVAVKSGRIETTGQGVTSVSGPGSLLVKSLNTPLDGVMEATTSLCVFVPRDFCRERVAAIDTVEGKVLSSGLGRLLASFLVSLDRQLRWLSSDDLPGVLAATQAMIDACIAPTADRIAAALTPINATLLERARENVQNNLMSPALGVDSICRELGISRSRLYRLFEDLGGVVHYIRSRRLLDAHRVLSGGIDNRPIVEIAAERDFLDPADFSRAFKREFGYSPREARLQKRPPSQHLPEAPLPGERGGSLGELLLGLS